MVITFQHGRHSVFNVSWNQKDSRRILSCGADGYWYVSANFLAILNMEF